MRKAHPVFSVAVTTNAFCSKALAMNGFPLPHEKQIVRQEPPLNATPEGARGLTAIYVYS